MHVINKLMVLNYDNKTEPSLQLCKCNVIPVDVQFTEKNI